MPRYDYILLDADHTLFDFNKAERRALQRALESHGYPFEPMTEQLYVAVNRMLWHRLDIGTITREELLRERFAVFSRVMGGHDDPDEFNRYYLNALSEGSDLLPGAEELCRTLFEGGCTLAIATNGVANTQKGRFNGSPLPPYFKALFVSEELGCQKPDPRFLTLALERLGVTEPRCAVMVGDNLFSDIQGGINAGLDTIWYNPGMQPNHTGVEPTYEVHSFEEMARLLLPENGNEVI